MGSPVLERPFMERALLECEVMEHDRLICLTWRRLAGISAPTPGDL